ncbi:MAG: hypothetical protein ACJAQT_001679 [Akkermansiaceae bacterium]|jgi:hypothetical protein
MVSNVSDGFDNIGQALVVSPLHVESFFAGPNVCWTKLSTSR